MSCDFSAFVWVFDNTQYLTEEIYLEEEEEEEEEEIINWYLFSHCCANMFTV